MGDDEDRDLEAVKAAEKDADNLGLGADLDALENAAIDFINSRDE